MKKGGCNGYIVESEVVENPTLPPYSKAQRHKLNKHYIEDTCILIEKAETEHNVFTGEKHTVQETLFCGYQSNDVKYKKTFIENEEILRIERKYAKKSANEELSFENFNKKSRRNRIIIHTQKKTLSLSAFFICFFFLQSIQQDQLLRQQ